MFWRFLALLSALVFMASPLQAGEKLRALIVDGQNNHAVWPRATVMMKAYLEETGLFEVDVQRTRYLWKAERDAAYLPLAKAGDGEMLPEPKADPDFAPDFTKYDVVISNFGWKAAPWPEATQRAFERFVERGGGFVSVHAADNSFPQWQAYNQMIGLGGWGDRTEKDGPYVYYDNAGKLVRDPSPGKAGAHGPAHEFPVTIRVKNHPITRGMPTTWLTTKDELYATLRGPAQNMTVLATGKDRSEKPPTDRHEPVMMVLKYGKGRVFHLTLGHDTPAVEGVGFITAIQRGSEWAATGKVTQTIPADFPTATKPTRREFPAASPAASGKVGQWTDLLDPKLARWEAWTGIVPADPENAPGEAWRKGTPVGRGDPYGIFSVQPGNDGKLVLKITGEQFAGLTTRKSYGNFHLTAMFRWGEGKFRPRKDLKRDNGILYFCDGVDGAFWGVWQGCLEMQVQETDMGDLFTLAGPSAMTPRNAENRWDPAGEIWTDDVKRGAQDYESPHGEWTRLDIYAVGNKSVHMVNGKVVLAQHGATDRSGQPLSSGPIQIQSEGAEAYYRDLRIRPIADFPPDVRAAAHITDGPGYRKPAK